MSEVDDFWAEVARLIKPHPEAKIFYRLYYDDQGLPLFYSMEDLPGNYIEIDQTIYSRSPSNVQVINGVLQEFNHNKSVGKLRPGTEGTPCDPRDVCVVVSTEQPHVSWKKTYES